MFSEHHGDCVGLQLASALDMDASECTKSPATSRVCSTAGEPSSKVPSDDTRADVIPLFGDEDTFVERLLAEAAEDAETREALPTEPVWIADVALSGCDAELVTTRRELRRARSEITEGRCALAQERARIDGLQNALELAIARVRVLEARCEAEMDRANHAEERACALAAELASKDEEHQAKVVQLEANGAAALAAAYLWFARMTR